MSKKISSSARYAFAIGSVAAATLIRMLLTPVMGSDFPFISYYVAVLVTTSVAGFAPGILTIFLGLLAGDLFFYAHTSLEADPITAIVYVSTSLTVAFAMKAKHRWKEVLEQSVTDTNLHEEALEKEVDRRIKAEESLHQSEMSFRILFGMGAVGFAQIDPVSGRFLKVNPRFCETIGYTDEELLGMTMRQIAVPADNDWDTRTFRRMVEGQSLESPLERRYVCKGGRTIWCSVISTILRDTKDQPVCTLVAMQDVTNRRRAEEGLQAAQVKLKNYASDLEKHVTDRTAQLKETVAALEGFCYNVAHDLRTPIRAVHGYAEVLVTKCALDAQTQEYAQHICRSAVRMEQMAHDLLTYGRMAREPMPKEPLHLGPILDHVLTQLAVEIDATKARIQVEHPLPQVLGHPAILEQVLLQLLRNALVYVNPEVPPEIIVRAETSTLVRIWVIDNGVGIAPQAHEKIFHIFERLHEDEEHVGSGIGLAIVKKGIERMGGHVGVVSKPGAGSSFWFELQRIPGAQPFVKLDSIPEI